MDITIGNRSAQTNRFNFVKGQDGDVSFDDTEAHAVITSVCEKKGTYWFDSTHGSNLANLRSLTSRTPSQAEAETLDSTDSLIRDKSVATVSATAAAIRSSGRLALEVSWTTPSGSIGGPISVEV